MQLTDWDDLAEHAANRTIIDARRMSVEELYAKAREIDATIGALGLAREILRARLDAVTQELLRRNRAPSG